MIFTTKAIFSDEQIEAFINALQVCISHEIHKKYDRVEDTLLLSFTQTEAGDHNLDKFKRLVPAESKKLDNHSHQYRIRNVHQLDLNLLSNFLLLTRLQDDQIIALATQDMRYQPYAETLCLRSRLENNSPVTSLAQARDAVFQMVGKEKMSLTELAKLTGLSQVSLSAFKGGGDIRLSNLLKIAKALGIKLSFSQ